MNKKVFLDTSFVIALSSATDKNHNRALELANELKKDKTNIVTSFAVILEIGNSLSKQHLRDKATKLLMSFENDPRLEIISITRNLYKKALKLFSERMDKDWSLTDCISFILMKEFHISAALTTDNHFVQAGFEKLF